MSTLEIRRLSKLNYRDPEPHLVKLREIQFELMSSPDVMQSVRDLRTNSLKPLRELRAGSIFAHGISQKLQSKVWIADEALQDYDFVTTWLDKDAQNFAKVQLKEVVSNDYNSQTSVQAIVDGLVNKYPASSDLVVAVHLTRSEHFDPSKLAIPKLAIGSLWVYGAISPDQLYWRMWGDLLQAIEYFDFTCPRCCYDTPTFKTLLSWHPI